MSELASPPTERPYHHGDLKSALLEVAETILERDGVQALTLRAAARAAGVSHAAPANHFGDLTGLLSELAAVGFNRFAAALSAATDVTGGDPRARAAATGTAYVTFARSHPGLFLLMFRSERLDATRPALRDALDAARQALRTVAQAATMANETASPAATPGPASSAAPGGATKANPDGALPARTALDQGSSALRSAARAAALWSLVHGFAMLLLDGRLNGLIASLPSGEQADDLLAAVLAVTRIVD